MIDEELLSSTVTVDDGLTVARTRMALPEELSEWRWTPISIRAPISSASFRPYLSVRRPLCNRKWHPEKRQSVREIDPEARLSRN